MLPEIRTSLALPERRAVGSKHQSTGFGIASGNIAMFEENLTLKSGLVTQSDLTRLHHKCETGVEGVTGLGLLLGGHLD